MIVVAVIAERPSSTDATIFTTRIIEKVTIMT